MAAKGGHIELCKFLLQETAHPDEDAILFLALRESMYYTTGFRFQDNGRTKLEALYDHFLDILGSNIDLSDVIAASAASPPDGFMYMTNTALESVLASQPTPFRNLPFAQQFATAVESIGWPADAFSMLLRQHEPAQTVRRTNEHGKTALHWAAEHFGEWSRRKMRLYDVYGSLRTNEYARLATELVSIGANVHAVYRESRKEFPLRWYTQQSDPFLALLRGVDTHGIHLWELDSLHDAVCRWGQILIEAGHDLVGYVSTVNEFLESIPWDRRIGRLETAYSEWPVIPVRLLVSEHSELILEMKDMPSVGTWEARVQSVPGAWPVDTQLPDVIAWAPQEMDSRDGLCWVPARRVPIRSEPYEVRPHSISKQDLHNSFRFDVWQEAETIQDDHGFIARILARDSTGWRRRDPIFGRRRSCSSPPSSLKHASLLDRGTYTLDQYTTSSSERQYNVHKCPLDGQWRQCDQDITQHGWRRCMHGLCDEGVDRVEMFFDMHEHTFEGWFLRNEEYVHVAKRYAERFCPERMDVVDTTLERVTERKRLAMGPKRREESDWM